MHGQHDQETLIKGQLVQGLHVCKLIVNWSTLKQLVLVITQALGLQVTQMT